MFRTGVKALHIQLLSRSREHTLDAWPGALSAGPRQKGEALLAAVPPGSPLANAMGVLAFIEVEKMAVALLLALGAVSTASIAEIGFRRIPVLAPVNDATLDYAIFPRLFHFAGEAIF